MDSNSRADGERGVQDFADMYLDARNRLKDLELATMKRYATALLGAATLVYALATYFASDYPWLAYVAYTAEAAMVGALADWFAVVALFRHPLNLRFIPHTAIFPANKPRLARQLGEFIQEKFLTSAEVVAKVREHDPAQKLAQWLFLAENVDALSARATKLAGYVLDALDDERIRAFLTEVLTAKLEAVELSEAAAQVLDVLTLEKRHHAMLEEVLRWMDELLAQAETQAWLSAEIAKYSIVQLADAFGMQAAQRVTREIVRVASEKLGEVRADPAHPLRAAFDEFVAQFIARLKQDPSTKESARRIKGELLANAALAEYAGKLWQDLRAWLKDDLARRDSRTRRNLEQLVRLFGSKLVSDQAMRDWVNLQILRAIPPIIEENRQRVGRFIEEQLLKWEDERLVEEMERNLGPDLQYIRINGAVVGAMVGFALTLGTHLIQAWQHA